MGIEKEISIRFKADDIKKMLIDKTHIRDDLAELLIGNLAHSEVGLEQLTRALLGVFPKAEYKVGDFIYVAIDCLPGWKVDKPATAKMESAVDGCVMGQITKIDLYSSSLYEVNCKTVLVDSKISDITWNIRTSDIKGVPEKPEEILEIIENLNKELPF